MKISDLTDSRAVVQKGTKPRPEASYRCVRREVAKIRYRLRKRGKR